MCRKLLLSVTSAVALMLTSQVFAEGQFIDIYPKTEADIKLVINTLEERIANHSASEAPPILLMLHGKEAKRFLRSEYAQNKSLIDATAKLAGFGVLEVKICETWMRKNMHGEEELFPFVGTVPYGAGELARLEEEEGYTEFTVAL